MSGTYNSTHPLAKLVNLLGQRLPKPAMFAVIGAIGCLLGALLGEILAQAPGRHVQASSDAPTELCLLIDCSGSMGGGKLQEVMRAATSFVRRQDLSRNPIGVVAFSTTAHPLVSLTSLRNAGVHIVAVGTGDANVAYLAELTGDPALVFFASQGGFDSAFRKAENAVYRRQLIDSTGKSYSAGMTLVRNVGWCVLVSLGLAFLLWGGQNAYLRRASYTRRGCRTLSQGGVLAGVAAGLVAQTALWLVTQGNASNFLQRATFVLAWGVLGGLMGRGMSAVVPNLRWQTALRAGGVGGMVAGATFLITATVLADVAGRLVGATIGYAIALVEELPREASFIVRWSPRETTTINLGSTPVTIGGGDDHVWLKGLPAKAYCVWMEGAKVFCKDQMTGKQAELKDKSTFTVARVEFQVAIRRKEPNQRRKV